MKEASHWPDAFRPPYPPIIPAFHRLSDSRKIPTIHRDLRNFPTIHRDLRNFATTPRDLRNFPTTHLSKLEDRFSWIRVIYFLKCDIFYHVTRKRRSRGDATTLSWKRKHEDTNKDLPLPLLQLMSMDVPLLETAAGPGHKTVSNTTGDVIRCRYTNSPSSLPIGTFWQLGLNV